MQVFEEFKYTGALNSAAWLKQPVFLQTFEEDGAKELSALTNLPVVQLLSKATVSIAFHFYLSRNYMSAAENIR